MKITRNECRNIIDALVILSNKVELNINKEMEKEKINELKLESMINHHKDLTLLIIKFRKEYRDLGESNIENY